MTRDGQVLLSVRDLVVRHAARGFSGAPLTAGRGVSLDTPAGGIYGLVGESGSGKSSLAHSIVQLAPSETGQVSFRGQELTSLTPAELKIARRYIQLVFQDSQASLSPRRNVLQTLLEPLDHFRIGNPASRMERVGATLELVGLDPDLRRRYPVELSGGQRQRVSLARALVAEPDLIIADEPLSSLDVSTQSRIIDLILDLRERLGIAFLFVSHDLSVVRRLADTVGVMYLGKIVESACTETLFSRPAHPYTRSLLASVPVPDPGHPRPLVLAGEPPSPLTPPAGCVFHMRCTDRLQQCSSVVPCETEIQERDMAYYQRPELKTHGHRVRCHLWNTTKT